MEYNREANVAQLDDFEEIIDVRSPAEFAVDHVPGARNCPVLDDAERAQVGTLYKQVSAFDAKRTGAALVARNLARHLDCAFSDRPKHWHPLIYCWRGGGRSDAMCEVLARVGWRVGRLQGGYQAYRRAVVAQLDSMPRTLRFRAVCGRTGSGKSRLLQVLSTLGAQVLDLEALACHRGSVLGEIPGAAQPTQKMFESLLWWRLRKFDFARPIFVESESRKIGNVQIPAALIEAIRTSACVEIQATLSVRIALLLDEYRHFLADCDPLCTRLIALTAHYGKQTVQEWTAMARCGAFPELVAALLVQHYDPAYDRSIRRNFVCYADAPGVNLSHADADAIEAAARDLLRICH